MTVPRIPQVYRCLTCESDLPGGTLHFVRVVPIMQGSHPAVRLLLAFFTIGLSEGLVKRQRICVICGRTTSMLGHPTNG